MNTLQPTSARRRLLRGAFAAPAALALHSGSALAAASNFSCVNRQLDGTPARPPVSSDGPGGWVRVQLWERPQGMSGKSRWYLSGNDFDLAAASVGNIVNGYLRSGEWREVKIGDDGQLSVNPGAPKDEPNGISRGNRWAAVRFVAGPRKGTVEIVGVIDTSAGPGTALSGSCWTSFAVNTAP